MPETEATNLLFEIFKILFNTACLWAAWYAGKEGWFQNQNRWICPHHDCHFVVRTSESWVMERIRDDHLMRIHS